MSKELKDSLLSQSLQSGLISPMPNPQLGRAGAVLYGAPHPPPNLAGPTRDTNPYLHTCCSSWDHQGSQASPPQQDAKPRVADLAVRSWLIHSSWSSSTGVLLLNACLTVVASQANSHKDKVRLLQKKTLCCTTCTFCIMLECLRLAGNCFGDRKLQ